MCVFFNQTRGYKFAEGRRWKKLLILALWISSVMLASDMQGHSSASVVIPQLQIQKPYSARYIIWHPYFRPGNFFMPSRYYELKLGTMLTKLSCTIKQNTGNKNSSVFLVSDVVNIIITEPKEKSLTTGRHIIRDIVCQSCNTVIGWKCEKAYELGEKYKEGRFVLVEALFRKTS